MKYTYQNPFYDPKKQWTRWDQSRASYETDDEPIEYRAHQIFHRINRGDDSDICDIVKDGVIISQRVTVRSCKAYIDTLTD